MCDQFKQWNRLEGDAKILVDQAVECHCRRYCELVVLPNNLEEIPDIIRQSLIANHPGEPGEYVLLHFDSKTMAEASTQPRTRLGPVWMEEYRQIVHGIWAGRYRGFL